MRAGCRAPRSSSPFAVVNDDALGDHVRRVVAAESLETQEAFVVYVLDEEADLVGVGGDHHPHVVPALFRPDNAAQ